MIITINLSMEKIMENIIEPNETFDFSKLTLVNPSGIQGGAYFTKIENNLKPLYIQTTKSITKQGFVKTGKKYYIDLMFDKNSEAIINWFENLEEKCRKLIYEKKDLWFQTKLEESDIETAFNSTIRVYKSGKFYLVRTNVKNNHLQLPVIKIYDENENSLNIEDIKNDTTIISILEIQGIKFTSRNFQIEIEIKQIMVLNDEPIFDNFLIKTKLTQNTNSNFNSSNVLKDDNELNKPLEEFSTSTEQIKITTEHLENNKNIETETFTLDELLEDNNDNDDNEDKKEESETFNLDIVDLDITEEEDDDSNLKECDFNLENANSLETMTLKKPNQVYFELYKEARKKAKIAKKNAILSYLEAKNIKKTYMLENMNDSDSDFDAEIDEVSESELEGL